MSEIDSVVVPDSLLSFSHSELGVEQKADVSLSRFFEAVLSTEDGKSATGGYLLRGELLVRKWLSHGEDFIGEPVFQVVVPVTFREEVLRIAHNQSGHLGVRKTYNYITTCGILFGLC